ncbi:MAG: tetratricopeptide repeat protein [Planctomycetes bacterium]|nr:tetratricopeptide repeat protein [Planctomycetota bacterium]
MAQRISIGRFLCSVWLAMLGGTSAQAEAAAEEGFDEVIVYPTVEDGSIMHWLAVSPLLYNVSDLGDSMSADVLAGGGQTELTVKPRAGERVQGQAWHKMHFTGAVQGPTLCELFNVAGRYFDYAITCCAAYVYSPVERPNAIFAGSSDDALKVILNGKKVWSNQIQRSPTYDGDQAPAPLRKGWNTLLVSVDQIWGGHLLCARFLDGGEPLRDIEISLDPPARDAKRHPAGPYNAEASKLMREADTLRLDGRLADALDACGRLLGRYPLADVAPRAAYSRATVFYGLMGEKSLDQPGKAAEALQALLARYPQDLLAEYALLDLARIQESALKEAAGAEATYRSFETLYPQSSLAPKALVALARLFADQNRMEDALLTYRKAMKRHPRSDEVMTATVGIADVYRLAGDQEKARKQYEAARAMAQDWHDNQYGVDVGKQAWLQGIIDTVRQRLKELEL